NHHAGSASAADHPVHRLREQRVRVHVANASEWVTRFGVAEYARSLRTLLRALELVIKPEFGAPRFRAPQLRDHAVASSLVPGCSYLGCPGGEELLFLKLDPLPRWIPQHHIEPSSREHLRKR